MVERKHKYLLETARALLFQSKLPLRYWGDCLLTATYIINRLLSSHLKSKCPYKLLYNQRPNYSHLKSFGCLCYPTVPKVHSDKLEPRTTPHVFIGYPFGTKGYKVMSLATKRIQVSRDIVFHEHIFPFNLIAAKHTFPPALKTVYHDDPVYSDCGTPDILVSDHKSDFVTHAASSLNSVPTHSSSSHPTLHISLHDFHSPEQTNNHANVQIRRSNREHKTPLHFKDNICSIPTLKATLPLKCAPPASIHANSHTNSSNANFSLSALFTNHHYVSPDAIAHHS